MGKLLSVGVAHDKAGVVEFFDGPRRWEAAGGYAVLFATLQGVRRLSF
jgi:hypothetical protein